MGIKLEVAVGPAVSSATKDRMPVIKSLAVGNESDTAVEDLRIKITSEPRFSMAKTINVKRLEPNERIRIKNADIRPLDDVLAAVTERTAGTVIVSAELSDETVAEERLPITLLPGNEWLGIELPEMAAAFITPRDPAVLRIAANAARLLGAWTGDTTMDRYASGNPEIIKRDAEALYRALQTLDIRGTMSKDIARTGCKVSNADTIMTNGTGTSFDLTLLFLSCAGSIGLNALLIFTKTRTVAGVWTDNASPDDHSDLASITRAVRDGTLMLVDCDGVASNKRMDMEASESSAKSALLNESDFLTAINIRSLYANETASSGQKASGKVDESDGRVKDDLTMMESWETRLLDLSFENELLRIKMTDTLLPIMIDNLAVLRDAVSTGNVFTVLGKPAEWDGRVMNETPFEVSKHIGRYEVLIEQELRQGQIRTPYGEKDVKKRLARMHRMSKASEDNCKNTLFFVMGLLKWFDSAGDTIYSPLVMMPASTYMRTVNDAVEVMAKDDESVINKTLIEKLRRAHGIDLSLDPLPMDRGGVNLKRVFETVNDAIRTMDGWSVIEGAFIGIFRPSRYEIWNDLRNRSESLFSNKLTKSIIDGKLAWDPAPIEDPDLYKKPMFVLSANRSQTTAVKAAMNDRTFVVRSPPSSGRTQTMANLMAHAMYNKKTVLLVSEKDESMASLKKRLDSVNLGKFCLHLTTANADKKRVLDEFRAVLDAAAVKHEANYRSAAENIERMCYELGEPLRATKKVRNCGLTIYDMIVRYGSLDRKRAVNIDIPHEVIRTITPGSIERWERMVKELIASAETLGHPMHHPLSDIGMTSFSPGTDAEVIETLKEWTDAGAAAGTVSDSLVSIMGPECGSRNFAELLVSLDELPEDIVGGELTGWNMKIRELLKVTRQSFEIVNNLRRTFAFDAIVDDVSSLNKSHERMSAALNELNGADLEGIDTADMRLYVDEVLSVKDKMETSLALSREVRKEWNDSILSVDVNALIDRWKKVSEKKLFAGGAKKAFMNEMAEHLRNKNAAFERIVTIIRPVEEYARSINHAKAALADIDVLEGGRYAYMADHCRHLEKINDLVTEKTELLSGFEDPDILCGIYATDPKAKEYARSLVSLSKELDKRRAVVERLLVTDISRIVDREDMDCWQALCRKWIAGISDLEKITEWNRCRAALRSEGLGCVADAYMNGMDHDVALVSFRSSVYLHLMDAYISSEPSFASFDATVYEERAVKFRAAMERFMPICRREVDSMISSRVPDATSSDSAELQILQNAISTGGRNVTIRSLLSDIRHILPDLFPCILTGPSSVPHYLADDVMFDIVVIDDAMFMPTDKAVGIIARGSNAVIVGDPLHIPPVIKTGDGSTEVGSIMDECLSLGLPVCDMKWAYNDEAMVEFCNNVFWDNRINTFPPSSNNVTGAGIKGVYVNARSDIPNESEAEMIVERVMALLRDRADQRKSVGVITFSESQKQLIDELLKKEIQRYPALSDVMYSDDTPLFVRLADSIQGYERDVILISVGIWKDGNGNLSDMSPLDGRHGDRILNAALSSSREEVAVFTTLRSTDIPDSESIGIRSLKALLEYTESGMKVTEKPADGLRDAVADALTERGYTIRKNIGSSRATIDIGIVDPRDPDRFLLGILLDGGEFVSISAVDTNYEHARMLSNMGWSVHRLWAMDWVNDPKKELDRIAEAVRKRSTESAETPSAQAILDVMMVSNPAVRPVTVRTDLGRRVRQLYTKAAIMEKTVSMEALFSNSSKNMIERDVVKIVGAEAPITAENVARRLCDAYGINEPSKKLIDYLSDLTDTMSISSMLTPWGVKMLWNHLRDMTTYDVYRIPPKGESRNVRDISIREQMNAIIEIVIEHTEIYTDNLITKVAELFGNESTTESEREIIIMCIERAVEDGMLRSDDNGKIMLG